MKRHDAVDFMNVEMDNCVMKFDGSIGAFAIGKSCGALTGGQLNPVRNITVISQTLQAHKHSQQRDATFKHSRDFCP